MAEELRHGADATASHGNSTCITQALVDDDRLDDEVGWMLLIVVACIRDSRLQQLLDETSTLLVRAGEQQHGLTYGHAADHLCDDVRFLGRDAGGTEVGFHGLDREWLI